MDFRIGHIAYRTRDMASALHFYRDQLGFRHVFSLKNDAGEPWIEYLATPDGRFVELFHPEEGRMIGEDTGYFHLCLEVDDCAQAVRELEMKGVAIRVPVKTGGDGNAQAWIVDPDGRDIEIMQLGPDSPQHRSRAER